MMKDIYYCIVLSDSQLDFLAGSKYGIDRMKVLRCLIDAAVIEETKYEKKGFSTVLHIGQAVLSEVDLANRLGYDKKTVSRLLDRMALLDIVASEQTNRTSVHTVKCVSAWYAGGRKVLNPYYVSMKERYETAVAQTERNEHREKDNVSSNGMPTVDSAKEEDFRTEPPACGDAGCVSSSLISGNDIHGGNGT